MRLVSDNKIVFIRDYYNHYNTYRSLRYSDDRYSKYFQLDISSLEPRPKKYDFYWGNK